MSAYLHIQEGFQLIFKFLLDQIRFFCEIRHILYIYLHSHSIVSVHFLQLACLSKCLRTTIDSEGEVDSSGRVQ